jgi:hypothetical protein
LHILYRATAPDDPESSLNRKSTNCEYDDYRSQILFFFRLYRMFQEGRTIFLEVYAPCYISTVEKGMESGAGKTGRDMKRHRCAHEVVEVH